MKLLPFVAALVGTVAASETFLAEIETDNIIDELSSPIDTVTPEMP